MTSKRKRYSAEFKAKVALEALRGELTTAQLATKHGIHPTMVGEWKKQALEGLTAVFADRSAAQETAKSSEAESLFESDISMSYAAIIVSILPSVEVLSRKAPVWCLPNACPHRGSALLPPNLSYQPIEITYSNRLSEFGSECKVDAACRQFR